MKLPNTLRLTTLLAIVPVTMVAVVIFAWFAGFLSPDADSEATADDSTFSSQWKNESGDAPSSDVDSPFRMASFRNPLRQQTEEFTLPQTDVSPDQVDVKDPELTDQQPIIKISLSAIDEYILVGRYSKAAEIMADFAPHAPTSIKDKIQLRQGLCAELMGKYDESLNFYRALTGPEHTIPISNMATVSASRLLIDKGNRAAGNFLLMQLLVSRERSLDEQMRGEVLHTLAWGLSFANENIWLLDEDALVVANRRVTPEELLSRWNNLPKTVSTSSSVPKLSLQRLTEEPSGVFISISADSVTLADVVNSVTGRMGWNCDCKHEIRMQLAKRSSEFDCNDIPLDALLDSVLVPRGLKWEFAAGTLTITKADVSANAPPSMKVAVRFLELATSLAPDHPSAPGSYLLLGTIAAEAGKTEDAMHFFQLTEDMYPKTPQAAVTTFNLGKAALHKGDREAALQYFFRTVDRVTSIEVDTAAFIYLGRLLMENDTPGEAISPLMRGLALSQGTHYEGAAALQLASALLMNGNPEGANTVLMNHRLTFDTAENATPLVARRQADISKHAALVSCLTRFWGSEGPQRIREGRSLLQALTVAEQDSMFGGHADYILGVAYANVGLDGEMATTFKKSLTSNDRFPLQQRMRSLLAATGNKDFFANAVTMNSDKAEAPRRVPDLIRKQELLSQTQAAFRQGDHQAVLGFCEQFLKIPQTATDPKRQEEHNNLSRKMLRLMGLAYQAIGRHEEAVKCFAGLPQ